MLGWKNALIRRAKKRRDEEVHQGRLRRQHGLVDQEVVIIEKSILLKFLIRVAASAIRTMAIIIVAGLAFVGLTALVYPEPRQDLWSVWVEICRQLRVLL